MSLACPSQTFRLILVFLALPWSPYCHTLILLLQDYLVYFRLYRWGLVTKGIYLVGFCVINQAPYLPAAEVIYAWGGKGMRHMLRQPPSGGRNDEQKIGGKPEKGTIKNIIFLSYYIDWFPPSMDPKNLIFFVSLHIFLQFLKVFGSL